MKITVQRLLDELGNRAWSGFNKDDMIFGNEEAQTALAELNAAHRYLMALGDFSFENLSEEFIVTKNIAEYPNVEGQILEVINLETLKPLKIMEDSEYLKNEVGTPEFYRVEYVNPDSNIVFYPVPDRSYPIKIIYNTNKFILDSRGNMQDEFKNAEDYLNMPESLGYLYMDCLVMRTIATNNKDSQDENYGPILNEFKEAWRNFMNKAKPSKKEQRFSIWQ